MKVTDMVAGQQVLGVSGPGGSCDEMRTGKVVEIVTDRWGTYAVVEMDDGSKADIHSLNGRMAIVNGYPRITSGCGIGWYAALAFAESQPRDVSLYSAVTDAATANQLIDAMLGRADDEEDA